MRLFIALRFPDIALRAMEDVQTALKTQSHSGNFSHRENLHLTLSFLGETAPGRVPALQFLLACTAVNTCPFTLIFDRLAFFPGRDRQRLYYLAADTPPELAALTSALYQELKRGGFPVEHRTFVPHVTLVRRCIPAPNLQAEALPSAPIIVPVCSMELMQSERIQGRLIYTPLFSAGFSGTAT